MKKIILAMSFVLSCCGGQQDVCEEANEKFINESINLCQESGQSCFCKCLQCQIELNWDCNKNCMNEDMETELCSDYNYHVYTCPEDKDVARIYLKN